MSQVHVSPVWLVYTNTQQTSSWALNGVHNSRQMCVVVSLSVVTSCQQGDTLLSCRDIFALSDPVTLAFDLILIGGQGIVMDYPCAKFGDFSFSRFDFIMWTDRIIDRQTESQRWINAIVTWRPSAWVSNYEHIAKSYMWKWSDEMLNHVQHVQHHVMSNHKFALKDKSQPDTHIQLCKNSLKTAAG